MNREYLLTYEQEIEILGLGVAQGRLKPMNGLKMKKK
ncbi:hypothetical protein RSJ8_4075 (plasmid) [Clostridium botulinum]|nr:hypothetical protein NPD1_4118 [Clostridium botulinum]APQ71223.1 hypothetical protein RSJ8_4075 [Clostridium botulinum]